MMIFLSQRLVGAEEVVGSDGSLSLPWDCEGNHVRALITKVTTARLVRVLF